MVCKIYYNNFSYYRNLAYVLTRTIPYRYTKNYETRRDNWNLTALRLR